jgi:hypothetical protein
LERGLKTCRVKASHGRSIREFDCQICRKKFILEPDKQVADIPQDHFIPCFIKAKALLNQGSGTPCSHKCSKSWSVACCVTCKKFLCQECVTAHNNYRGHDNHCVRRIKELPGPGNPKESSGKEEILDNASKLELQTKHLKVSGGKKESGKSLLNILSKIYFIIHSGRSITY